VPWELCSVSALGTVFCKCLFTVWDDLFIAVNEILVDVLAEERNVL